MNTKRISIAVLTVIVFALTSCVTTSITQVWNNKNFAPLSIRKIMVVGIAKEPARQRIFEDEFAKRLAEHGIEVVKSYEVISLEELKDTRAAKVKIGDMGVDAVLATRLIDKKTVETYYPPAYDYVPTGAYYRWGGYYGMAYPYMVSPGYTKREEVAKLETNIYDMKTEELIWSALSNTWVDEAAPATVLNDLINVLVDRMVKDGIIPPADKK
ncbi:MAG: hypothetical protein PHE61_00365 [Candidatus Omnitrophica bacterium]|nr:hypothetical protein [Candidatus Omnitrophota bacterium]